jgi:hypothetical protein
VSTYEPPIYSGRRTEIDCDFYGQKAEVTAMFHYLLDLFEGQAGLVVRDDGDLPRF